MVAATSVRDSTVEELHARVRGPLLRPGDEGYDAARKLYNGMIDRHPALIARCTGVADVMQAVSFARTHGLPLAVKGGGHNVAGNALCDGGLVVDLSLMRGIWVDPATRTVRAQGGATWGELDHETQAFALATTGGLISTTGIGGLTLGGGLGWLMGKYGLASDNLRSVDLVTAAGECVRASATENSELFWGLRGGGGNFGVATSLEYQLHPVGPVLAGLRVFPIEQARAVLQFYHQFTQSAPDELGAMAVLLTLPDGPPAIAIAVCYSGPTAMGEAVLQPLREFGSALADDIHAQPYTAAQAMLDAGFASGLQNYWKSSFLTDLSEEAIDVLLAQFAGVTSPLTAMAIEHLGGAVGRIAPGETAFPHRGAEYNLLLIGRWSDPAESQQHIAWTRDAWTAMQPYATGGVYVNYLSGGEEDRVGSAYGAATYERLAVLKREYDPTNLFHANQNIEPSHSV